MNKFWQHFWYIVQLIIFAGLIIAGKEYYDYKFNQAVDEYSLHNIKKYVKPNCLKRGSF